MNHLTTLLSRLCIYLSLSLGLSTLVKSQTLTAPDDIYYYRNTAFTGATLYWHDNSTGEDGFEVQQRMDGGSWTTTRMVGTNSQSTNLNGLDPDASIEYRVRAYNASTNSPFSKTIRLVGRESKLEVYPEVLGIRNPKDTTIDGITFGMMQDQCPAEPSQGKATRVSTFFRVEVREAASAAWKYSPTYERRNQIKNNLAQNDPSFSASGHALYSYGKYGPNVNVPTRTMHSKHWNNFDAEVEAVVRITLLDGADSKVINMAQTEIFPEPLSKTLINDSTIEITLAPAKTGDDRHARHYMIAFNRSDWEDPARGPHIIEHPLQIFVNPVKPARASAPDEEIIEFDNGAFMVFGSGIHLPDPHWQFYGPDGGNSIAKEVYIPGDAIIHGGFMFNKLTHPVHVWGRGMYSFDMHKSGQEGENNTTRTPWADVNATEENPWGLVGSWGSKVNAYNNLANPVTFEGLSNVTKGMGVVTHNNGHLRLIDHKDVGYAGGLYQKEGSKTFYWGIYTQNNDDITYTHFDYEMHYCTSRNMYNGPTFQIGWAQNTVQNAKARVYHHTIIPSDRPKNGGGGHNHGVINSRLQSGGLEYHMGGLYENFTIWGSENFIFNIGVASDRGPSVPPPGWISIFGDKTFKNFTITEHSRKDNQLFTRVDEGYNQESYIRFLHFDSLIIEGNHVEHIDDGDFFDYNEKSTNYDGNINGTLLHTITFFSLPDRVAVPAGTTAPVGQTVPMVSSLNKRSIQADKSLPVSLAPLCANSLSTVPQFNVIDAGDGYIALEAPNGYYVKADTLRYGYIYTEPDLLRGDPDTRSSGMLGTTVKTATGSEVEWETINIDGTYFYLVHKATGEKLMADPTGSTVTMGEASETSQHAQWRWIQDSFTGVEYARLENREFTLRLHLMDNGVDRLELGPVSWTGDRTMWKTVAIDATSFYLEHKASDKRFGIFKDPALDVVGEDAKFRWVDLGNREFALYSKAMGLYVRMESNAGPEMPLYAASNSIGPAETFSTNDNLVSIEEARIPAVSVFPNPTSGKLQVDIYPSTSAELSLFSLQSRLLQSISMQQQIQQFDFSNLANGIYFLKVKTDRGIDIKKFVKE